MVQKLRFEVMKFNKNIKNMGAKYTLVSGVSVEDFM